MRRSRQTKDKVDRLAAEIATQSDAGRMRMIVQRFAREVIPDSKAIVRQAIHEQAEVVEQRISLISHEVHESVKDNEAETDRLRQMIQENREAVHRSHAASEDEILKDLEKLEKRMMRLLALFRVSRIIRQIPHSLERDGTSDTTLSRDRDTESGLRRPLPEKGPSGETGRRC